MSARTAILVGLPVGLACGLLYGLVDGLLFGPSARPPFLLVWLLAVADGLLYGLPFGLLFGLAAGLAFGGYACLSHCALRLVLWRIGALPLDSIRFLDYAAERVLLRRVGGGYIFVHGLLQDYFASLESDPRP